MLRPARFARSGEQGESSFVTYVASWSKADFFKDWVIFNTLDEGGADVETAAFGGFVTAPDGTEDTARLLTDTTANSKHSFIAGWNVIDQNNFGKIRLAGIFKYAGRRIVLEMTSRPSLGTGNNKFGCKAVFDLVNGRVAVDTTAFGSPAVAWTLYPAKVHHVTAGWYLCWIEAQIRTTGQEIFGRVYLDNGVGLAAESSTYAGDGTSGVYGWRSNMLPSRAWNLGRVVFFDDFDDDTMANIDLEDTRAPGFDWYIHNKTPTLEGNTPADPENLSVADSVFTCTGHTNAWFMATFASTWNGSQPYTSGYVGRGWVIPALFEARAKWDISQSNQTDHATMWTVGLEYMVRGNNQDPDGLLDTREYDFFETSLGKYPASTMWHWAAGPDPIETTNVQNERSSIGLDVWYANHSYQGGIGVERLGSFYTSLHGSNNNNPPESSPEDWGPYVQVETALSMYQPGVDMPVADYRDFHDFATLWLPYDEETGEPGQIVQFYDGAMVTFPLIYGPGLTSGGQSDLIHASDWQQMPLIFGCGPTMGISFDWVRVTK